MINSNNIRVYLDTIEILDVIDVSIDISNSLTEITSKPTGGYREVISGIKGGTVTVNGYTDVDTFNTYEVGSRYMVHFGTRDAGWEGEGIISGRNVSGAADDTIKFSIDIEFADRVSEFIPMLELQSICYGSQTICYGSDVIETGVIIN